MAGAPRLALDGCERDGIVAAVSGRSAESANAMDLTTLIVACALGVDPKLMHALVWHQSGGEPWAISVPEESTPRVYRSMQDALRDVQAGPIREAVRVGLAGVSVTSSKVSASLLLPCRNVAMATVQIGRNALRCKAHPRLKADPMFCAIAVYRGTWEQPDVKFATDVSASAANGDAPDFHMPPDISTDIFDTPDDTSRSTRPTVVDMTAAFAEQNSAWSSALFPQKTKAALVPSGEGKAMPPRGARADSVAPLEAPPSEAKAQERRLFVHRSADGRLQ